MAIQVPEEINTSYWVNTSFYQEVDKPTSVQVPINISFDYTHVQGCIPHKGTEH